MKPSDHDEHAPVATEDKQGEFIETDLLNESEIEIEEEEVVRKRLIDPNEELTDASARSKVLTLAVPAVAEQFLMSLIGMADMMMVGSVGAAAIASVGLTNQPMLLAMAVFMALNTGTTAIVARLLGAGRAKEANEAARQTLVMICIMGLVMSVIMFLLAEPILLFMGAEDDTMYHAVDYFRIVSASMLFNTIMMAINSIVRGAGDTKTPMFNNVVSNLVNLVFNYILINGIAGFPRMEVAGAAVATLLSRVVGAILALYVVLNGKHQIYIDLKTKFVFNFDLLRRVMNISIPSALEQFVMRAGQILFVKTVSGLGTTVYAAHQVALNIVSLSFTPGQGFAMAATTLVGQSLGANRSDWAEKCTRITRQLGLYVAITMGVVFFFAGDKIAYLYSPEDMDVVRNAAIALQIIAFVQPFQSAQFIYAGALRGAGDTKWPLYSTIAGVWGFRVTLSYLFVQILGWGLHGAWYAMVLDQLMRSTVVTLRFNNGGWKKKRI